MAVAAADGTIDVLTVVVDEGDGQRPVSVLADRYLNGERGLVDLRSPPSGRPVWLAALGVGIAMVLGGLVALRRGLGSVSARRRSR